MTSRTFNDAFGDLIRHLKFQMRKVLETRNLNQATRHSLRRKGVGGRARDYKVETSSKKKISPVYARYGDPPLWGPPVMGHPGPHNARDMGTGGAQISSVIGTGGPRISGDMGIL